MKKYLKMLFLCIVCCFVFCGCSDDDAYLSKQGIIYAKEQKPSYTEIVTHSNSYKEYIRTYDKANIIYVKYKEEFGDSLYKTYAFYVSEDIYNQVEVGDEYLYNAEKDKMQLGYTDTERDED